MAVKYLLEYKDTDNAAHKLEIYDDNYTDDPINIQGVIFLDYGQVEKSLEAIRGNGLRVELEASPDRKFTELFTSGERSYSVIYYRANVVLFRGWVNPEGYYEDFVADKWIVSLDCIDGLGFLENLSYVDSNGLIFTGKQNQLEIIVNCLKRTGIAANINTNIDIYYDGLSTSVDVLANVYANTERFVKDDGDTIMSCEEVLRDTLDGYAACITMHLGEWYIYKPNQLFKDTEATFFRYDSDGVALSPTTQTFDTAQALGSQIDNFYPHHAGGNQSLSLEKAIGAYRIVYEYGFVKGLLDNIYLQNIAGVIDDWTIGGSADLTLPASGEYGVYLPYRYVDNDNTLVEMYSDNITVGSGDIIVVRFDVTPDPAQEYLTFFTYRLKVVNGGTVYYFNDTTGAWQLSTPHPCGVDIGLEAVQFSLTAPGSPQAGNLVVEVIKPVASNSLQTATDRSLFLTKVAVEPNTDENVQGETHTFQRTDDPSSKIEDNKEVYTGDNPTEIYVGALFENDETTPTENWTRKGEGESKGIIQIMGEETMRMNGDNMTLFTGDIYGYLPYLGVYTINNVPGLFMFIKYSYNTATNTIQAEFRQILGDELTDIDYRKTLNYGNVVEPTIKS